MPAVLPGYDWSQFGRHRFRAPGGVLVDSPVGPAAAGWLATLWPGGNEASWARMLWQPDTLCGGWTIPARLAGGDVIEFGDDRPGHPVRWYGIIDSYDAVEWLVIQGPYADPCAAHGHAQELLAQLRYELPLRAPIARLLCTRRPSRRW